MSCREGYCWAEDKEHCEEYGRSISLKTSNIYLATMQMHHPMIRMLNADPSVVSNRAKKRGLPQLGTLGAGNHYAEIQVNLLYCLLASLVQFKTVPWRIRFWNWLSDIEVDAISRLLTRFLTNLQPARWESRRLAR